MPGYNLRSTEINAVAGIEQLKKLPYLIKGRRKKHQLQNWKIDSIKNTEDTKDESNIVITITRNESQIEESFDMNLNVFQKKLKSGIIIIKEKTFRASKFYYYQFWGNKL